MTQTKQDCNNGREPLVLTRRRIEGSVRRCELNASEQSQLAAYVERACRRHDWNEDARREELPPYEIALAHVVVLEAVLRRLTGRMRDGSLVTTGFEPWRRDQKVRGPSAIPAELAPQRLQYVEPEPEPYRPPSRVEVPDEKEYAGDKDQRGFCLGNVVDVADELSWFYGQSALEVGYTSTFDGLVWKIASHGASCVRQEPVGPNPAMMAAARRQREVMVAMRQLPPHQQALLEVAYTDRRYRQQFVTTFGAGVAAIVARADHSKRAFEQSPEGEAIAAFQRMLMALTGRTRKVPDWSPLVDPADPGLVGTLDQRKRTSAEGRLRAAQRAYAAARGLTPPEPHKRKRLPKRPKLEAVPVRSLSPRRQLIEVVRAA